MKLAWWMLSGSVLSSLLITTLLSTGARRDVWLGMLGPLASAVTSWIAMERQFIRRPAALTGLLIKAFAGKMIFFGVYITALLEAGVVRPFPFVVSFVSYFVSLHALEAIGLRRLQAGVLKGNK
jgi:hypothetical protein